MTQKRKKRVHTPKSRESELNQLMTQAMKTGVVLAERGLEYVEDLAHQKDLFKVYPYLEQAFSNVKGIVGFFQAAKQTKPKRKAPAKPRAKKSHAGTKKRRTNNKKVSKPKTLRHSR